MAELLDASGVAIPRDLPKRVAARARASSGTLAERYRRMGASLSGGALTPYDAADGMTRELANWVPWLGSPDTDGNPYRNMIVARIRDLVRNDGWASGAIGRLVDAVVGGSLRLVASPDWRALKLSGANFDSDWAQEFRQCAQALWRSYSYDLGKWCDTSRRLTMPAMFALAFRHKVVDGDAIVLPMWRPGNAGPGRAKFATSFQIIDPDRLSNPQLMPDQAMTRGGCQIDEDGATTGYYFRCAHQADWMTPEKAYTWEFIERETPLGRPLVIHDFTSDRANQHRSPGGILKTVIGRLRMLFQYDAVELQASVINAILGAYIESPFDHTLLPDAIGGSPLDDPNAPLPWYQDARADWHKQRGDILLNGAMMPTLFPGEVIKTLDTTRPNSNFEAFEQAVLRNVAQATGQSAQEVSNNWSDVNYSSARAALIVAHKSMSRMRAEYTQGFCTPVYACWLEEAMARGMLPLPAGAPKFFDERTAYAGARWMGPGRGWIDPLRERQGAVLGLDSAFSTLEIECAEQGLDYEEVLAQRKHELDLMKEYGITPPNWAGNDLTAQQTTIAQQPE
jgi:lambda family phage portal protein